MAHRTHFAVEKLSVEGRKLVDDRLGRGWSYARTAGELKLITDEDISASAVARYHSSAEARKRIEAAVGLRIREEVRASQDQAGEFINALKSGDLKSEEIGKALLGHALFENRAQLQDADPIKLSREERERQKLEIKRDEHQLHREEHQLHREELEFNKRKFEAIEKKLAQVKEKAAEVLDKTPKGLTPEQVRGIKEIYDLA